MPQSASERAVKDTARQFGGQLLVGLVAVFCFAWLNRLMSPGDLAIWPICMSLGGVLSAIGSFGLGDTFVRIVPARLARGERNEALRLLRTGLLINLLACALLSVAIYFLAIYVARFFLHDPAKTQLVQRMAVAAFFIAFGERLIYALQAVQEFGRRALINVITGILRTPLALALYLLFHGTTGVVVALTITPGLGCLLAFIWLWRHLRQPVGFSPPLEVLRTSLPFYGVSLMSIVSTRMNQLVIALFAAPQVVATYFVANSIAGYIYMLDRYAVDSTTPKLSEKGAVATSVTETEGVFRKCTRYLFLGLVPVHLLIAVAATPLLRLYGGAQYAGAGWVLAVLCIGSLAAALADLQRAHMVVFSRPLHVFWLSVVNSVSNVLFLVVLVPLLGALGAAFNDAAGAVVAVAISTILLSRTMRMPFDYRALLSAVIGTAAGGLLLWLVHPIWEQHALAVLPLLGLAAVVYMLALARQLDGADVRLFFRCMPGRLRTGAAGVTLGRWLSWLWLGPGGMPRPTVSDDTGVS